MWLLTRCPVIFNAVFCSTGVFCTIFRLIRDVFIFPYNAFGARSNIKGIKRFKLNAPSILISAERALIAYTVCVSLLAFWLVLSSMYRFALLVFYPVSGPSMSFTGALKDRYDRTEHAKHQKRSFPDFTQYFSHNTAVGRQLRTYTNLACMEAPAYGNFYKSLITLFFERFSRFYRNVLPINIENWIFFVILFVGIFLLVYPLKNSNSDIISLRYYWLVRTF